MLSGTANQSSGIPVAGTANLTIGSSGGLSGGENYFKGLILTTRIIDGLLTPQEISALYSAEKDKYGL